MNKTNADELERWLTQMENTSSSVGIAGKTYVEQIRKVLLDDDFELPEGCPSKASLLELTLLRRIEKNLQDANYTFEQLRKYIWENYGDES